MSRALRAGALAATYGICLVLTSVTGLALFWGSSSLWPLVYILGVPLAATLYADRRLP